MATSQVHQQLLCLCQTMPRSKIFKHLSRFDELCKHTNTAIRLHSTCALCRRLCSLQLLNTLPTGRAFLALFANSLFKVERYLSSLAALFVLTRHANPNMGTCRPMHLKSKNHKDFIYLFIYFVSGQHQSYCKVS